MIPILLLAFCLFRDDFPIEHWLDVKSVESKVFDPNVPVKHTFTIWPCSGSKDDYLVVRCKDANDYLEVTSVHRNRMNYEDFAIYARQYKGDPNYQPPPEPNEPTDPNISDLLSGITDPNFAEAVKKMLNVK